MDHDRRDGDRRSHSLQPRRRNNSLSPDGASRSRSPDRRGDHTRDQKQANPQGNRHQSAPFSRSAGRRGEDKVELFQWRAERAATDGGAPLPSGGQQLQLVHQQQSYPQGYQGNQLSQQGQGYQGYYQGYQGYEGYGFSQELHPQSYPQGYYRATSYHTSSTRSPTRRATSFRRSI